MRSRITLLVGLNTVLLFLSIYGTPYVNGQSSINDSSDNETSTTNSEVQTDSLDPFTLRGSSSNANTGNTNDPAQADDGSSTESNNDRDGSSTESNNDDTSIANDGSSTESNNDRDGSSTESNNDRDGSSTESNNDDDPDDIPFP